MKGMLGNARVRKSVRGKRLEMRSRRKSCCSETGERDHWHPKLIDFNVDTLASVLNICRVDSLDGRSQSRSPLPIFVSGPIPKIELAELREAESCEE